ncbi:hypothetical protein HanPI659440_Chr17g0691931 [Helianthus annuus]|nr:hypothetical protein HanPI659440_Chr17g0691931 [Helianthus annuus]
MTPVWLLSVTHGAILNTYTDTDTDTDTDRDTDTDPDDALQEKDLVDSTFVEVPLQVEEKSISESLVAVTPNPTLETKSPSKRKNTDVENVEKPVHNPPTHDFFDIDPFTKAIADSSSNISDNVSTNFDFANFDFLIQREPNSHKAETDGPNKQRPGKEVLSTTPCTNEFCSTGLGSEHAAQNFTPTWALKNGTLLKTGAVCQEFLYQSVPPAEMFANRRLSGTQFSDSYTTNLVGAMSKGAEMHHRWVHTRARKDYYKHRLREMESSFVSLASAKLNMERELCELREKKVPVCEKEKVCEKVHVGSCEQLVAKVKLLETELQRSRTYHEKALAEREQSKTRDIKIMNDQLTHTRVELRTLSRRLEGHEIERSWLITNGFRLLFDKVKKSDEFLSLISNVSRASACLGFQKGLEAGYVQAAAGGKIEGVPGYDNDAATRMKIAAHKLRDAQHSLITIISSNPNRSFDELKSMLLPSSGETSGATSSAPSTR